MYLLWPTTDTYLNGLNWLESFKTDCFSVRKKMATGTFTHNS